MQILLVDPYAIVPSQTESISLSEDKEKEKVLEEKEKVLEENLWEYKNYIALLEKEKTDLQESRVPDELLNFEQKVEQKVKKQAEQLEMQYQLVKYLNLNEKKAEKKKRTKKRQRNREKSS